MVSSRASTKGNDMTKEELDARIEALKQAADQLEEPDKTFKNNEVEMLLMQVDAMALDDIARVLSDGVNVPGLHEIDAAIAAAVDATETHNNRVAAFNRVYGMIKGAVGLA